VLDHIEIQECRSARPFRDSGLQECLLAKGVRSAEVLVKYRSAGVLLGKRSAGVQECFLNTGVQECFLNTEVLLGKRSGGVRSKGVLRVCPTIRNLLKV